ncbi:peptide/nickel transport system substrate-binding protein [Lentzea fradiae]|uniref:Peptide/nickel transport system substrate-binding protein n=1 Tax=Lentzea fradiae TaxID=200378 RepID=A0A1G7VMR9_9PSEU|nr:ABC transporter substrate-binding protein [Lentzea fradiae]SDG60997.1 peptide/nickel transport system substrate-binding protein [Lentzea fradiae]
MFLLKRLCGVTLAVALTAGCAASGGRADDTLVVYTGQAGDYQLNFNPYAPTQIEGPGTIYEPLFFYNIASDGPPKPMLGTAFEWNADGTELSITLRDDATWSDGQKFTSKDVVFTLDMVAKTPAMNRTGFRGTATATDDTHVVVKFPEPSYMDGPQVLGQLWMMPEHIWKNHSSPATEVNENPVGTGPYTLGDFKAQSFTLKANPAYWGGEPAVKQVRYLSLSGNQAGVDALKAGSVDWQTGPIPDIADIEKNYPGYKAITLPLNQVALFTCSNAQLGCQGAQTDPAVRKAIYYGMNRTQINSLAFQNLNTEMSPGFTLLPRDNDLVADGLTDRLAPMSPDVAKADQLLTSAGYVKGGDGIYAKDGTPLALTVKVVAGWTDYITALETLAQQMLRIGVKLTPQQLSWNEWADARGRGQYELLIDSVEQGPAPDPYYTYSYFFSTATTAPVGQTATPNFSRFSNPVVDQALAELKKTDRGDPSRQRHYDAIQVELEKSMPYIPVLTGGVPTEYNARGFTGWPTEDDLYAFPAVWKRPDASQVYVNLKPAGR